MKAQSRFYSVTLACRDRAYLQRFINITTTTMATFLPSIACFQSEESENRLEWPNLRYAPRGPLLLRSQRRNFVLAILPPYQNPFRSLTSWLTFPFLNRFSFQNINHKSIQLHYLHHHLQLQLAAETIASITTQMIQTDSASR